jgi:hypothetical protein
MCYKGAHTTITGHFLAEAFFTQSAILAVRRTVTRNQQTPTMQRTFTQSLALVLVTALIIASMPFAFTFAHDGEDHSADAPKREKTVAELEAMLSLLQQLVKLLQEQRALTGGATSITTVMTSVVSTGGKTTSGADGMDGTAGEDGEDGAHDGEDGHSGHDGADGTNDDKEVFAIEIETHHGDTHVHMRYVDAPEEQFFVDADIDDEEALIEDIHEKTGYPKSIIEPALVYL